MSVDYVRGSREADDGNGKYIIIIIATHGHALCLWWGGAGRREGRCAETHTVLPGDEIHFTAQTKRLRLSPPC